jgi:ribonuclease HI
MLDYDVVVYVDGSFRKNIYSGAFVVCKEENSADFIYQDYGIGELDDDLLKIRNISGEISACMQAIQYLLDNNLKGLIIHDYIGLGHWAKGEWQTNNKFSKAYAEFAYPLYLKGTIGFKHVKGHSGNIGNEQADELANRAIMEMKKWGEISQLVINKPKGVK